MLRADGKRWTWYQQQVSKGLLAQPSHNERQQLEHRSTREHHRHGAAPILRPSMRMKFFSGNNGLGITLFPAHEVSAGAFPWRAG